MVVLGGAKITGGSGTIAGTVLGVLILSYLQDGSSSQVSGATGASWSPACS